jgi:hypothetical protein
MEKVLKPTRLDLDVSAPNAAKHWKHWRKTFENFITEAAQAREVNAILGFLILFDHIYRLQQ